VLLDVGAIADAFTLDSSTLDGTDVLDGSTDFVDATEYVLAVAVQRGRTNQTDQFSPGTCRVLADDRASGRLFDPANTASTWYQGDFDLAPRRAIKVLAGTAELFVGAITDLDITYELPNLSFASIVSADGLYELSRTALTAFTPSSQLTSARVSAILDRPEVNFSTALRNISTGIATCGTVAYTDNTNTLSALQAVAIAEDGRLFANRRNQIQFDERISFTFSTAIASFGGTATNDIPILAIGVAYGQETLFNRVQVDIDGGTAAQVAQDSASQTQYGVQTLSFSQCAIGERDGWCDSGTEPVGQIQGTEDPLQRDLNEFECLRFGVVADRAGTRCRRCHCRHENL
jgi:hypothetical protein